jgi:hypothetical protein
MKQIPKLVGSLFLCSALSAAAQVPLKSTIRPETAPPDPCSLLSAEEIQAVQGAAVQQTKRSQTPSGTMITVQCFFEATDFGKSVSLAVVLPNDKMQASARQFWMERFHPKTVEVHRQAENAQEAPPAESQKKKRPPRAIPGLGEEAYWVGNNLSGSLYVLQDEFFVRISVGGPGDESAKIERSKALAQYALKRLSSDADPLPKQP